MSLERLPQVRASSTRIAMPGEASLLWAFSDGWVFCSVSLRDQGTPPDHTCSARALCHWAAPPSLFGFVFVGVVIYFGFGCLVCWLVLWAWGFLFLCLFVYLVGWLVWFVFQDGCSLGCPRTHSRPGWPRTQKSAHLCLPSAMIKGLRHHCLVQFQGLLNCNICICFLKSSLLRKYNTHFSSPRKGILIQNLVEIPRPFFTKEEKFLSCCLSRVYCCK